MLRKFSWENAAFVWLMGRFESDTELKRFGIVTYGK